jgi:hypothetical protein
MGTVNVAAGRGRERCLGCGARYDERRLCCPACGDPNPRLARATPKGPGAGVGVALAAALCLAVSAALYLLWH